MNNRRVFIKVKTEEFINARIKSGLSIRALGRKAGISNSFVSQIEKGNRSPGPKIAVKIAKGLNTAFDDIFFISCGCNSDRAPSA